MRVLTVGEVALRAGVSGDTVRRWEREGRLPATRTATGLRLFQEADVARFLTERQRREETNGHGS